MKRYAAIFLLTSLLFVACNTTPNVMPEIDPNNPNLPSSSRDDATASTPFSSSAQSEGTEEGSSEESSAAELPPLTQKLVIPEGYTLARVGMTLEEIGICTTQEFIDATETGDFSEFPLIASIPTDANIAFTLEGYLHPNTYEIYTEETIDSIIRRLLTQTESKINADLRAAIDASAYTPHQILTLASIIEKEAFGEEHMADISSVLHNRLNSDMMLQCDVTIAYVEGAIKPFIDGDKDRYNEHYNTYKTPALPPGPICNPSIDAVSAALNPSDTDYLYFLTNADKEYFFTDDFEVHKQNARDAGIAVK